MLYLFSVAPGQRRRCPIPSITRTRRLPIWFSKTEAGLSLRLPALGWRPLQQVTLSAGDGDYIHIRILVNIFFLGPCSLRKLVFRRDEKRFNQNRFST